MMELKVSKEPLLKNPNCTYCGNVFNKNGLSLRLEGNRKVVDLPLCPRCLEKIPLFEATVDLEQCFARIKR